MRRVASLDTAVLSSTVVCILQPPEGIYCVRAAERVAARAEVARPAEDVERQHQTGRRHVHIFDGCTGRDTPSRAWTSPSLQEARRRFGGGVTVGAHVDRRKRVSRSREPRTRRTFVASCRPGTRPTTANCDTCGNDYDKAFTVQWDGGSATFDSIGCAAAKLAPECAHCGCRILGHGVETEDDIYCCADCACKESGGDVNDRSLCRPGSGQFREDVAGHR